MAERLVDTKYDHIVKFTPGADVCDLAPLFDQIFCILLRCHVGWFLVPQNSCVIFGDSLIGRALLEEIVFYFWDMNAVIGKIDAARFAQKQLVVQP